MQSFLRIAAVLSVLAFAACASPAPRLAAAPAPQPAVYAKRIAVDDAYVARVNQKALRRGLQVQWVNPPLRRTAQD